MMDKEMVVLFNFKLVSCEATKRHVIKHSFAFFVLSLDNEMFKFYLFLNHFNNMQ
jgi:hypothetical protein